MNNRAIIISLLMAVVAIFFVSSYVDSIEERATKQFGTKVITLKARRDIKEMETLNETMIELAYLPKKFLEPAAVTFDNINEESEEGKKVIRRTMKELVGTVAVVPIKRGEQITYNKLTEPSLRTGLAPQIAPGRRAISIPISETTGVAKLVKPGDRIDLIATIDGGGGKDNKLVKTVLQDTVVLAVGRSVTNNLARTVETDPVTGKERVKSLNEDFGFASVTLEVEPAQAQMIVLLMASSENALTLSLRNNDDNDRIQIPSATIYEVLGPDAAIFRTPAGRR